MKSSQAFKDVIKNHLDTVAAADLLFAETYKKPEKNIDDCVTYILNAVKKSGYAGFADEEVFGMAMHYYDEDKIDIGNPITGKVVINQHVELSAEEKEQAKTEAKKQAKEALIKDYIASEKVWIELTPEEKELAKEEAKQQAINKVVTEQKEKQSQKTTKKKETSKEVVSSLFDL